MRKVFFALAGVLALGQVATAQEKPATAIATAIATAVAWRDCNATCRIKFAQSLCEHTPANLDSRAAHVEIMKIQTRDAFEKRVMAACVSPDEDTTTPLWKLATPPVTQTVPLTRAPAVQQPSAPAASADDDDDDRVVPAQYGPSRMGPPAPRAGRRYCPELGNQPPRPDAVKVMAPHKPCPAWWYPTSDGSRMPSNYRPL